MPIPIDRQPGLSLNRLAAIVENANDAIVSVDAQLRITLFNSGAERMFGYTAAEAIGQPLDLVIPEAMREAHRRHVDDFGAGPQASRRMGERGGIHGLRKDGSEFPAEASISRQLDDGAVSYTAIVRDVSDRVEREQALQESEERLKLAVAAGRIGLFEHHYPSDRVFWSRTFRDMLGIAADAPASLADYLARVHPEERAQIAASAAAARAVDGGRFAVDHRIVRPDGEVRWLSVRSRTFFDSKDGSRRKLRTIGAVQDITEHKQLERGLEQLVDERTRALREEIARREQAQAALARAQRMEAFGQLAGGVAHDFNNLITVIAGNLELLEMRLTDDKSLTLLKRAQHASDMGARLTDRLLTFARRRKLEPALIDLNEHVGAMIELLRRAVGEQVTLRTGLTQHLGLVRADASEIENAVLNLAINARDAMPGGGTLIIETDAYTVDEVGSRDPKLPPGEYIRLSVADTGSGMAPEVLVRAIEPFFTTKPPGHGTGLGLSTIYGMAQELGGTVSIYSEPGHGTTVNIYLPRVRSTEAVAAPIRSDAPPRGHGETVLIVEDNDEVRRLARARLESLGYRVLEASNGPQAVALLQGAGHGIAIVFSDVVMPGGMSGFDLAHWVAGNAPGVKVLLTSGYPETVANANSRPPSSVRLLRKPASRADVARALRAVLDG